MPPDQARTTTFLPIANSEEAFIIYTPRSQMTLDEVRDITRQIEDLLVLLTDCERSLGFPRIRVNIADDWCQVSYETLQRPEKEISRSDLWTLFPELSPDFGVIADAWFNKSAAFGPGFHLYLGNRRGMQLYVEHRFASLVWGLEALHRASDQTRNTALTRENRTRPESGRQQGPSVVRKHDKACRRAEISRSAYSLSCHLFHSDSTRLNSDDLQRNAPTKGTSFNTLVDVGLGMTTPSI